MLREKKISWLFHDWDIYSWLFRFFHDRGNPENEHIDWKLLAHLYICFVQNLKENIVTIRADFQQGMESES